MILYEFPSYNLCKKRIDCCCKTICMQTEGLVTKWEGIRHPILPDLHRFSYIENGQAYCNVNAYICML